MPAHGPLLVLLLAVAVSPLRAETVEHGGATFWVHRVDPKAVTIELHLSDKAGEPNTFPKLEANLDLGAACVFTSVRDRFLGNTK